jgi:hypothetical protein
MDATCVICMSKMSLETTCQLLSCKHEFHSKCIQTWLIHSEKGCPICRSLDTTCSHGTTIWDHDVDSVKSIVGDLVQSQLQQQTEYDIRIQDMKRTLHEFNFSLVSDPMPHVVSELPIGFWTQEDRNVLRVIGLSVLDSQRLYKIHQETEIQELEDAIIACQMNIDESMFVLFPLNVDYLFFFTQRDVI